MAVRVDVYAQDNAKLFPAGSRGAQLFKALHDCVVQAQTLAAQQDSGARTRRQSTQNRQTFRVLLRGDVKRMSETARGMDFDMPGLAAKFKMPGYTDFELANAARTFLAEGEPLKEEFIKNELPPDFFDKMRAHLADFEAAGNE
jgi:hypothetical protein